MRSRLWNRDLTPTKEMWEHILDSLQRRYRRLVTELHPDREIARGLPEEAVRIATTRLAVINAAWDRWFLEQVCQGNMGSILSLTPADVERDGGNGGEEIRNWITVMAAAAL